MSERGMLHCTESTTAPYERVRDVLQRDAEGLFQRATNAAAGRNPSEAPHLHIGVRGLEIGTSIQLLIREVTQHTTPQGGPATSIALGWTAESTSGVFPAMEATITAYPLAGTATRLEFSGQYSPPLGAMGMAFDALVGHRVAEATVLRFMREVAAQLDREGLQAAT